MMNESERWAYLCALDEDFLKGGVILSEWCTRIVCEADKAFAHGTPLAAILAAVAAIETYLRAECDPTGRKRLLDLINGAHFDDDLTAALHRLRKYRNKWVHVDEPWEDMLLLRNPEGFEAELEEMALFAIRALRRTIYQSQWV